MKKVITYGTFDLFHQGHYNIIKRARALGDYLIVGVTSESFDINVKDKNVENEENNTQKPEQDNNNTGIGDKEEEPTVLPQTGNTIYFAAIPVIGALFISYFAFGLFESQIIFELGITPYLFMLFMFFLPNNYKSKENGLDAVSEQHESLLEKEGC